MKTTITVLILSMAILMFSICGCQKLSKMELSDVFVSESEIDKMLVNFALAENGAKIYVSEDNPNHPASTLNNGIASSDKWHLGEGWEDYFDELFSYGRYAGYGEDWRRAQLEAERRAISEGRRPSDVRVDPEDYAERDYKWRGLRRLYIWSNRYVYYAMGWVVVELPEPKRINRVIVWTVDSSAFPAKKYGVRDVGVQYWAMQAKGWQNVNRYDKKIGQKDNSIRGNVAQKIVFKFKPVKTDKVRVVIRWTNDAEKYKIGFLRYAKGTIRLTEIEIYGFERKSEGPQEDTELEDLLKE